MNKTNWNKTLHLVVEINQALFEGLVDTSASMSIMAANVVKELGIMHLVLGHETYKIAFGMVIQALGIIIDIPVTMGRVVCQMVFLMVDIDSYDLLLGLDFLMKIGAVVDVEKCVIQVQNNPSVTMEVMFLNIVNMM
jgi:predicted aspartyl protease